MAGCVGAESAAVVPNPRRARAESMAGGARGRQLLARGRCGSGGSLHCPLNGHEIRLYSRAQCNLVVSLIF
jgi:hypothetical protein